MEQRYLSLNLFGDRGIIVRKHLDKIDSTLLFPAIRAGLLNEDGRARSSFAPVLSRIPFDKLQPLLPAIYDSIKESSPSGIMFSAPIQMAGLKLFTEHKVSQNMELIVKFAHEQKKHGSERRLPDLMNMLKEYGAHAKRVIPLLEKTAAYFEGGEADYPMSHSKRKAALVRKTITEIKGLTATPKLIKLQLK